MARTKDKYILMDATSSFDKLLTGSLIILTMFGILLLFWFQNFGLISSIEVLDPEDQPGSGALKAYRGRLTPKV